MKITKAIILAAGYGTRFLPITKAMPKEMLPVVDKPVIQYAVEDVVSAGIKDIVLVTSAQKRPLEDHFDHTFELETVLEKGGKVNELEQVRAIANLANFIYVRQKKIKGTMGAFSYGYKAMPNEPFVATWGDDFFVASPTRSQQLVAAYEKYGAPILGCVRTTNPEHGSRYAFAEGDEIEPGVLRVRRIIEKPGTGQAGSEYACVSGFVFTPELMTYADKIEPMKNGEYGYSDAVAAMVADGKPVYAMTIQNGRYYDCGNKLDYIKTNIELALQHPEMREELSAYLRDLTKTELLKVAPDHAKVVI
ncbi:MAG TPA: UTP--glucose-1-phosphate uridylyltransferase [Patescibacteria group bacterium]